MIPTRTPVVSPAAVIARLTDSAPLSPKVVCAWCATVLREGVGPVSHGMCPPCVQRFEHEVA
jgi:hypothetical protein